MTLRPAAWSRRRVGALWSGGLLLEAALLLFMWGVLVRPEPPLVAQLRGDTAAVRPIAYRVDILRPGAGLPQSGPLTAPEDSFYTVVHWPPGRPLLQGGGHVVALPMRLWWVPALYVGAVPLLLVGLTAAWLWARRGAPAA